MYTKFISKIPNGAGTEAALDSGAERRLNKELGAETVTSETYTIKYWNKTLLTE
jgi:hypothetical protein